MNRQRTRPAPCERPRPDLTFSLVAAGAQVERIPERTGRRGSGGGPGASTRGLPDPAEYTVLSSSDIARMRKPVSILTPEARPGRRATSLTCGVLAGPVPILLLLPTLLLLLLLLLLPLLLPIL